MSFWDDFAKEQATQFENLPPPMTPVRSTLASAFETACAGFAREAELSGYSPDQKPPDSWYGWYLVSVARECLFGAHYGLSTINPDKPLDARGIWRLAGHYSVLCGRHFADGGEQAGDVNQYTWATTFYPKLTESFPFISKQKQHELAKKWLRHIKAVFDRGGIKTVIQDKTIEAEADHLIRWINFIGWLHQVYVVDQTFFTEASFHRDITKFGLENVENCRRFDLAYDGKYLGNTIFDVLDALRQLPTASYVPKSPNKPTLTPHEALGALQEIFTAVDQYMVPIAERSVKDRLAAAAAAAAKPPNNIDLQPSGQKPQAHSQPTAGKYIKPRGLTKDEANTEVRKYLRKHRDATIREIVAGLNASLGPSRHTSIGQVQQSTPWKAEKARRGARRGRSVKTIRLTANLAGAVGVDNPDLAQAIEEQAANFEPSPLERTRHKVRVTER